MSRFPTGSTISCRGSRRQKPSTSTSPGPAVGVGIGIGVAPPVYAAPGPQVYGYVSTGPSTVVVDVAEADRPSRAGGCGTYR